MGSLATCFYEILGNPKSLFYVVGENKKVLRKPIFFANSKTDSREAENKQAMNDSPANPLPTIVNQKIFAFLHKIMIGKNRAGIIYCFSRNCF